MPKSTGYLLDTCAWLWLMNGDTSLTHVDLLEDAARQGQLWVSPISCWEVGVLAAKGRIHLGQSCSEWVQHALSVPGIQLAELTPSITVESSFLPGEFHPDPADRMLVATARHLQATLVTRDSRILAYGQQGYVKVLAC